MAIVGHTGSGKTSIISLLNRLYHIQKGAIRIDDVNIEDYKLDALAKKYRGGVAGCISIFRIGAWIISRCVIPAINKEQVIEAAKMIDMHDFIMRLPGGYDYNVMERGAPCHWVSGSYYLLSGTCYIILPY